LSKWFIKKKKILKQFLKCSLYLWLRNLNKIISRVINKHASLNRIYDEFDLIVRIVSKQSQTDVETVYTYTFPKKYKPKLLGSDLPRKVITTF
jgi:hypothetical protein